MNAAGCMTLALDLSVHAVPRVMALHRDGIGAGRCAQGVRDALDVLLAKRRGWEPEEDLQVVVTLTGDGSCVRYGSVGHVCGAIDRNLDFLYVCYDNEGYGNTGQQYFSGDTPHGSAHRHQRAGRSGYPGFKKDLFSIWTAHNPDLRRDHHRAPSPWIWRARSRRPKALRDGTASRDPAHSPPVLQAGTLSRSEIDRDRATRGRRRAIWPLKEYVDGRVVHTKVRRPRLPVEEYLSKQGRFAHLFRPERNEALLGEIQARVDAYWENVD